MRTCKSGARIIDIIKREFGWICVDMPIIGEGTWMIENGSDSSNSLAIKALQLGLDLGITHIDTANI